MKISVIGLGYVGLPLFFELSKESYEVLGFDINKKRIQELLKFEDSTKELTSEQLKSLNEINVSSNENDLLDSDVFIVTVPTPITNSNQPDFAPLIKASTLISKFLKKDSIVIYESTVYPGATEEICVPILEDSGLKYKQDFQVGYSPERINPGDKEHTLRKIKKIVSASSKESLEKISMIYESIVDAGIYKAKSIMVAEAAKVIENAQRDINIAFVNELSVIFNKLELDTTEVLDAASTKWNFLPFKPGLVGGHCIGVDPYYLAYKAELIGYKPEIILSGRRINDALPRIIAEYFSKTVVKKRLDTKSLKTLILGSTFKENCPDFRNTKVVDIYKELKLLNLDVDIYDPNIDSQEFEQEYSVQLISDLDLANYNAIIIAVAHQEFLEIDFKSFNFDILFDLKGILEKDLSDFRL